MTSLNNEELTTHVVAQQEQITKLVAQITSLNELNSKLLEISNLSISQLQGFGAALQVFAEWVMAANPEIKTAIAIMTEQALSRPETMPNEYLIELVRAFNKSATSASRTTPDGRRAHFQVIDGGEPSGET